jgi:hypothetical protein
MATVAPMPTPTVNTIVIVRIGARTRQRTENRRSCAKSRSIGIVSTLRKVLTWRGFREALAAGSLPRKFRFVLAA